MSANSQTATSSCVSKESFSLDPNPHEIAPEPRAPTDSGRDAWMTVVGIWLVQFCTYGYVSAFGVYQDFYTRQFLQNTNTSNISWIGSVQLFLLYAPGVLVGRAFDAGYFHYLTVSGSILHVSSMFMLSLARKGQYYEVFLAQALGSGLGQSLLFLPSITVIGHHFKCRRALATGIAVSGAPIGGIIWPVVLNYLFIEKSFQLGTRVAAAISAFLLFFANVSMRTRCSPVRGAQSSKPTFNAILRDDAYMISVGAAFLTSLGLFFPYFYIQLYAVSKGIDKRLAAYLLTIINAGGFLGRLLPGVIADGIGPYNLLVPCLSISSGLIFSIFGIRTFAGASAFGFLYGFWSGSYVSLIPSLLAQLSTHVTEQGTRMGVAFSIVGTALLVGTPIAGALVGTDKAGSAWNRAIVLSGTMVLGGALAMALSRAVFLRERRGGQRGSRV